MLRTQRDSAVDWSNIEKLNRLKAEEVPVVRYNVQRLDPKPHHLSPSKTVRGVI